MLCVIAEQLLQNVDTAVVKQDRDLLTTALRQLSMREIRTDNMDLYLDQLTTARLNKQVWKIYMNAVVSYVCAV